MGYDEVLMHLGDFGRYQRTIYFLICLSSIICAFHKLAGVFLLAKPRFRCLLPFEKDDYDNKNTTIEYELSSNIWPLAYPYDTFSGKYQTCRYYDVIYSTAYLNGKHPFMANGTKTCDQYIYDQSTVKNSAVTEWNLVCQRSYLAALSDSLFMAGVLLGSIVLGQLSDRYGRKPIFITSLILQMTFGILVGIVPEYYTYASSRFVVGASTSGVFLVAYVIAMEMVGPAKRLFAGIFVMMFFSFGYILITVFAYLIQDWRNLQIALTLPSMWFMTYYWIIPESTRWLLSKHRYDKAIINIRKAAHCNKIHVSDNEINELLSGSNSTDQITIKATVLDLLRHPNMRRKSILIFFDWFVNSGTYYGLSWNASKLGSNLLINFVISGLVELPAYSFLLLTLNRWGRRSVLCCSMLTAGTVLILTSLVPNDMNWLLVSLAMIGKFAITASYGTVYIFSAEQFPTVVRNVGLGASSMFARIGGILAPFLNMLSDIWLPLPLLIFGSMVFVGGLLSLLLPETLNQATLETIDDGERFGNIKKTDYKNSNGQEMQIFDTTNNTEYINDTIQGKINKN